MTKYLEEITILKHVAFGGTAACASQVEVPKPTGDDRTPRQTDNVGIEEGWRADVSLRPKDLPSCVSQILSAVTH